ncbi:Sialic acid transporter NanT [Burkholderia ambifaria]
MSAPTARAADGKRYTYEWYVVVICMLAYVFSFVDRQVLVLMIEPIKRDLHLTDTQFSLLNGFAFSLFYAVMGLPVAYLADRYARPRIIALGIALWSVATAACGLSQQFVQMFIARMGVGVGEAALSPGAYSMLADYFPKEKLGRAIAVYSLGSFIGGGVAFLIGGYVIALLKHASAFTLPLVGQVHAWQVTFLIVGLPGILVALLFAATVRDPQRKGLAQDRSGAVRRVSMRDSLRFVGTHRATFSCHYLGFSFYAMTLYCLLSWTPAFYIRHFGMTAVEAGYTLGIVLLVANTAGVFCGGWLNDWLLRRVHGASRDAVHAARQPAGVARDARRRDVLRVVPDADVDRRDADARAEPDARADIRAVPARVEPDRARHRHDRRRAVHRSRVRRAGGGRPFDVDRQRRRRHARRAAAGGRMPAVPPQSRARARSCGCVGQRRQCGRRRRQRGRRTLSARRSGRGAIIHPTDSGIAFLSI